MRPKRDTAREKMLRGLLREKEQTISGLIEEKRFLNQERTGNLFDVEAIRRTSAENVETARAQFATAVEKHRDEKAARERAERDCADWKNRCEHAASLVHKDGLEIADLRRLLSNLHLRVEERERAIVAVAIELAELRFKVALRRDPGTE